MTKPTNTQSEKRKSESLASRFSEKASKNENDVIFMKSSSDEGVIRNGGRNGARFAPQSLLSFFKKFNLNSKLAPKNFLELEVSDSALERKDFNEAQAVETGKIQKILAAYSQATVFHLGGGHDHVYPLLSALGKKHQDIIVINIDAHADTRADDESHSGNPFRKFSDSFNGKFHLVQVGLHPFANSMSTMAPLKQGKMSVIWKDEISKEKLSALITKEIKPDTFVLFSLDADALCGHLVPGVSAVNGDGLNLDELKMIREFYSELTLSHRPLVGIYELNPVYDTLSALSMRTMAGLLYDWL